MVRRALSSRRGAARRLVLLDGLAPLEPLHHLVGDGLGRDLALAEGDVEVGRFAVAHLADHVRQQRRDRDLLHRQAALAQRLLERLAAALLRVLAPFLFEEGADLVAGAAGAHQVQPVARRPALLLGGQDFDDVAGAQLVVQRDDVAVDLGADAAVADVGVDRVGEVERGRAGGEVLDLALRREDEDLVLEQVDLQRLEELGRVLVALRPRPAAAARSSSRAGGRLCAALLVGDVGGDAVLGEIVHLARSGSGSRAACPRARSRSCAAPGTCWPSASRRSP